MAKEKMLQVRLTDEEAAAVAKMAKRERLTVSATVRRILWAAWERLNGKIGA